MINVPNIENLAHDNEFIELFDEKLSYYKFLMDKVKNSFFGDEYKYANLSGSEIDQIRLITDAVLAYTNDHFELTHQQYALTGLKNFSLGQ